MKILLVENDFYLSELLTEVLVENGFKVQTVFDGLSPLSLVEKYRYDLIIMSVILPKLNGIELCRKLRLKGCSLPIVFWSSQDFPEYKHRVIRAGADDYLLKPCKIGTLLRRINSLLGRQLMQPTTKTNHQQLEPEYVGVA